MAHVPEPQEPAPPEPQEPAPPEPPPNDVLESILGRLPPGERLQHCARVCRSWREAAAGATREVSLQSFNQEAADALAAFLVQPGAGVVRLQLQGDPLQRGIAVRLPAQCLAQLHELEVLQLPELHAAAPGGAAPQLTRLLTDGASFAGVCAALQPLSALGGLRHLELRALQAGRAGQQQQQQQQQQLGLLLAHATQLTALQAQGELAAGVAAAGLSDLHQLQLLRLPCVSGGGVASWLPALPGGLTELALERLALGSDGGSSAVGRLAQLTGLRQLELSWAGELPPAALSGLTGLRHLRCQALPGGSVANGAAGLLDALAQLTQLEELQLERALSAAPARAQHYAALTASSQLTALRLAWCGLPAGAAQHMFGRAGAALPQLRTLRLEQQEAAAAPVDQAGLASMVACCPALEQLTLSCVLCAGVQLAPLAQLAALSRLDLSSGMREGVLDDAAVGQLAACTGLQSLELLVQAPGLTDAGVGALTRLTQLRSLRVLAPALSRALTDGQACVWLRSRVPPGGRWPPDVCRQLEGRLHVAAAGPA